jgi:anti-sigma factor RsiW
MNNEQELKLQAFFDGELPEAEAREVASWLARDADATALLGELKNTRKALDGFEKGVTLPESREFFWSKIQREIEKSATVSQPVRSVSIFTLWRHWLVPAGAVAVVAICGLIAVHRFGGGTVASTTETELADAGAMTYHNYETGTTLVWFSYPADNQENNTTVQ